MTITKAITLQGGRCRQHDYQGRRAGTETYEDWTLVAGLLTRVTGIEFQDGGRVNIGIAHAGLTHRRLKHDGSTVPNGSLQME